MSQDNTEIAEPSQMKDGEEFRKLFPRKIPGDKELKLVQYVRDLYDSGAKLWTKDMFRDIEATLAKQPRPSKFKIRSMNGAFRRMKMVEEPKQKKGATDWYCVPLIKLYQEMVKDAEEGIRVTIFDKQKKMGKCDEEREMDSEYTDDDKTIATCALNLAWMCRETSATSTSYGNSTSYVELKAAWDEAQRNWKQSSVCKELIAVLGTTTHIPMTTNKIVCFGLGNLKTALDDRTACDGLPIRRGMTQHAAALTMAAVLAERLGTAPLPILAQDPAYTSAEKQVLKEAGIEVVEGYGTLAFTYVDEDTLVFTCSPDIPVKQVVADIAKPAAMIWDRVKTAAEEKHELHQVEMKDGQRAVLKPWTTNEDSPRTRKLVEEYDMFDFPSARDRFGDLKIYIRRE